MARSTVRAGRLDLRCRARNVKIRRPCGVGIVAAEISGLASLVLEGPLRPMPPGHAAGLFYISRAGVVSGPSPLEGSGEDVYHQIGLEVDVDVIGEKEAVLNSWTVVSIDGLEIRSENDRKTVAQLVDQLSDKEEQDAEEMELNESWP